MRELIKKNAAGLFLLIGLIYACGYAENRPMVDAVKKYNKLLAEAYRAGDADILKEAAGPADLRKVMALIDINKMKGVYLDSELVSMDVEKVEKPTPDTAQVWTSEKWEYAYKKTVDKSYSQEPKKEKYELVYFLSRRDNRWRVEHLQWKKDFLKSKEESKIEKKDRAQP